MSIVTFAADDDDARLLCSRPVRRLCGDVSEMTLWRWQRNRAMCFPTPIVIAKRRYWRRREVLAWLESHAAAPASAPAADVR
jgi:predicted DNA-binding transcriptional regulator AlpA